jgi:uncharacterized membrane protein YphA (DoxX/SURF4 family)
MKRLLSPWIASLERFEDDLLHRPVPVEPLCLYRAGFGLLIFLEAATWLPHTRELFSNEGFHLPMWQLDHPSPPLAAAACVTLVVAALCLALGFFTRWANAFVLVFWTLLYAQDRIDTKAIHSIIVVILAILLFTPSGAAFSIDARRAARWGDGVPRTTTCALGQRLIQLEVAQVYFFCGVTKMTNPEWVDGSVFYRVFDSRWASDLGIWVSGWLPPRAARAGGLLTILYELLAPFLLFQRSLRPFVIVAGIAFHLGIQSVLSIGSLGAHFLLALVILFPDPEGVRDLARRLQHPLMDHQ